MATLEGTRASSEFMCVSLVPDVCKSPTIPVPYKILSLFDCAVKFSTNVRFRKQWVFRHNSRLSTVRCDEPGVGGGVLSGVNMGFCRPIDGTSSTTVRVNGSFVDYHVGTYMFMNCAGPEGPFNTIGQVIFLGNMLPGPVSPSGKVPKSCILGDSGMLADLKDKFGDIEELIEKGKKIYALAQTDWSNPSAVLGAMGGLAGIAELQNITELQDIAKAAGVAKELYDVGNKIANTDWSDPAQALAAVAGAAGVAGMKDIAQVANLANTIRNTINTDWSDPKAALASATNLMKATGLNQMVAEMASNTILDDNIPVSQGGTTPPFFPKPGAVGKTSTAGSSASAVNSSGPSQCAIPPSPDGLPRKHVTPEVLDYLKESNPAAYDRFNSLSGPEQCNAFIETQKPAKDSKGNDYSTNDLTAIYIPGEGFSTSKAERDGLPNVSGNLPDGVRNTLSEVFVASKDSPSIGSFFGIKEKEGNVYLLGGLVDLGSPEMPGAGNTWAWWVPDRILNMDMSPYYDYHDKGYYGSNVGLADLGKILNHELDAFKAGATLNPLQLPLQAIYSAATTAVGVGTAVGNDLKNLGSGTFNSIGDFFGSVFGSSTPDAANAAAQSFAPGGCFPTMQSTILSQSGPGAPAAGSPATSTTAGASAAGASGAGTNGVLITTKAGNPAAAAAAIEAQFRKENQAALDNATNLQNQPSSGPSSASKGTEKKGDSAGKTADEKSDSQPFVRTKDPYYDNRFTQAELDTINNIRGMTAEQKMAYYDSIRNEQQRLEGLKDKGRIDPQRYEQYMSALEQRKRLYGDATADGGVSPVISDEMMKELASVGADVAPIVGNIKSGIEATFGIDPVSWKTLSPEQRVLAAAGVILPGVKYVKGAGIAGDVAKHLDDIPTNAATSAAQMEKLKLQYAADEILNADRIGKGLKDDPFHRGASFLSREELEAGKLFPIRGGDGVQRQLLQTFGEQNGKQGVFEFILDSNGTVTHQMFKPGGKIDGIPK